jgi:hypothetical protein
MPSPGVVAGTSALAAAFELVIARRRPMVLGDEPGRRRPDHESLVRPAGASVTNPVEVPVQLGLAGRAALRPGATVASVRIQVRIGRSNPGGISVSRETPGPYLASSGRCPSRRRSVNVLDDGPDSPEPPGPHVARGDVGKMNGGGPGVGR